MNQSGPTPIKEVHVPEPSRTGRTRTGAARPAVGAPAIEPEPEPEVTEATGSTPSGKVIFFGKPYADVTDDWQRWLGQHGGYFTPVTDWVFLRSAETTLARDKNISAVTGWCVLDGAAEVGLVFRMVVTRSDHNLRRCVYDVTGAAHIGAEPIFPHTGY